jgi:hypothetical protein
MKIVSTALLLIVGVITILSFKKNNVNPIIGNWEYRSMHLIATYQSNPLVVISKSDTTFAHGKSLILEYHTDGTYTTKNYSEASSNLKNGRYSIINDKKMLTP